MPYSPPGLALTGKRRGFVIVAFRRLNCRGGVCQIANVVTDAVVSLEQVVKTFGSMVAVDHLDLEIRRGEFFSMLGPSGCGKTTTLRMIGGFEEPTEGTVRLDGRDVTDLPAYKRDVNTVFQSYGLFPHLNVFDNVAFGLRRRKVTAKEVERRV